VPTNFPCHRMPGSGVSEFEIRLSMTPSMQGESIAAQLATLLTRLTGLATLQVRRCGHWQEVRLADMLTPAAALYHLRPSLQLT
jgi:hypothetical protein